VTKRVVLVVVLALAAATVVAAGEQPAIESYIPGFGEFMSATQVRHSKLWFAGTAENWALAEHELEEIKEGLEDAATLHPTHKDVPVAAMIKSKLDTPLAHVAKSINAKDNGEFIRTFDELTAACNACHKEASYPFIKIKRPTAPPVTNQEFGPSNN